MDRQSIVEKALTEFKNTPTLTLAKKLYSEYPDLFTSLEACRTMIRRYRGNTGTAKRKQAKDKRFFRENGKAGFVFKMPKSIAEPKKDFIMPDGEILFLSDVHVPYHDDRALETALSYGDKINPDMIHLNGDCMDFFSVSRWEKNPLERNLPREIYLARQFLAHLRERFPKSEILFKVGNHEERWEKFLWAKCPELCGCEFVSFDSVLDLKKFGVQTVLSKQKVKYGKNFTAIHGHELFQSNAPVNFARTLQTKLNACAIGGHRHQTSEHTQKNVDDKYVTCWSVGCLCDMSPDYAIINQWNHGFAHISLKGNDFHVRNKRIIDGVVV
jgi:predicted phosphodiesterase